MQNSTFHQFSHDAFRKVNSSQGLTGKCSEKIQIQKLVKDKIHIPSVLQIEENIALI